MTDKVNKNLIVGLLIIGLTVLVCSTAFSSPKKYLRWVGWSGLRVEHPIRGMAKEFSKIHPNVEFVIEAYPYGEFISKIALDVAGGGGSYDLVWTDYKFIGGYADAGYLQSLDSYFLADPSYWADVKKDILENVLNMYRYKGHWWALPVDSNTQAFYYRKDLLENIGVNPPKSWDEVLEIAPKLHKPPKQYALGAYYKRFWAADAWFAYFFSAGGQLWDENYVPQLTSSAGIKGTTYFKKVSEFVPREALEWGESEVHEAMELLLWFPICGWVPP